MTDELEAGDAAWHTACRQGAGLEELLFGKPQAESLMDELLPLLESDSLLSSLSSLLGAGAANELKRARRHQDDVIRRLWELMGLGEEACQKALSLPKYRDLEIASALLAKGWASHSDRSERAEKMAGLAGRIAQLFPSEEAAEIAVEARCLEGSCRRRYRDWAGAEERFQAALPALAVPLRAPLRALFCRELAELRVDQGRLDEAVDLYWHAMMLYRAAGRNRKEKECLLRLGLLFLRRNHVSGASMALAAAGRRPSPVAAEAALGQAACMAAVGLAEPARQLLEQTLPFRRAIRRHDLRLPYEWFATRVALRLGDLEHAVPRLEAVYHWLLDHAWYRWSAGDPSLRKTSGEERYHQALREGEAWTAAVCVAAIDLVQAYEQVGRGLDRIPSLLSDLAWICAPEEKPWALDPLLELRAKLKAGVDPCIAARAAYEAVSRRETHLAELIARSEAMAPTRSRFRMYPGIL